MLGRSGARRLGATQVTTRANIIGVLARRVLNRVLTVTKCEAAAGASCLLKGTLRVFAVSDLHTHHRENLNWVRQLSTTEHQHDVLIVAGDISDDLEDVRITLSTLRQRFAVVFFCPGNHELWVSGRQRRHTDGFPEVPSAAAGAQELQPTEKQAGPNRGGCGAQHPQQRMVHDSLEKLAMVMTLCHELGVHVMPARLGRLQIVPLLAWHHKSFDREPDIPGIPKASPLTISDYARCTWPERIVSELEASRCFGSCPGRQHERQNQRHYQHQQQHEQQQQRQEGHVMRDCNTSAPDPATADTTAVPKAECMNSSGRCGGAGFGGDWVDGGHGSDAVAAWFDALNEPPYGWGYVHNNSTSSGTTTATSGATAATTATTTTTSGTATNSDSSSRTGTSCRPSDTERSVQTSQQGLLLRQQQQQPEHQQQHTQEHRPQHAVTQSPVAGMGEGAEEEVQVEGDVISFSHFLPLQELMPEKRYLTFPNLAKAVGSTYLAERVRRLRPQMHVFGHTHFAWDAVCDGIRYVQAPLAYPSERRFRLRSLVMTEAGGPKEKKRNGTSEGGGAATVATDTEASSAGTTSEEPTSKTPLPLTTTTASTSASVLISEPEAGPEAGPEACGTQVQHGGLQGSLKSSKAHAEPSGKGELHMGMQEHEGLRAPWPSSLDPGDARWLPLCIYRAQYTVRMLAPGDADRDRGWGVAGEGTAATAAAVDLAGAPSQLQQLQPVAKLLLRPAGGPSTRAGVMAAGFGAAGDEPEKVPEVEVLEWRSQWCPEQAAMWSSYYKHHSRRPQELQLAPWVAERYSRRLRRKQALGSSSATASTPSTKTSTEDAIFEGKAGGGTGMDILASGESDPEETELE